jgi:AAA15 family ATPase/GTPase
LYGANGSGKTFFCKIIREIQRLLDWSPLSGMNNSELLSLPQMKGMDEPITTFAFDTSYSERPTRFVIEVILDGITYHYEFSVLNKKIEYELLTKKYRRTEKLIERTSPSYKDIVLKSELKNFENTKQVVKEEALCLPIAALLNNELALRINAAVKGIRVVSMTAARLKPTNSKEAFSDERLAKYIGILQKADPTLRDIKVSYEEEEIAHQKIDSDDFENREIIAKKMTVGVDTIHAVYKDGKETTSTPITFFADESLGTVKLFTALPYLFDVLESGGVLVIDEIENGLHLSLAREIVSLFMDETTNPNHAQLICTSHQPLLLDGEFRRDQVWITNKDAFGKSNLYRLSDYKTSRAKVNLTNRILEGAFGCNPDVFFK